MGFQKDTRVVAPGTAQVCWSHSLGHSLLLGHLKVTKRVISVVPKKGVKAFIQNDLRVSRSLQGAFVQIRRTYCLSQRGHALESLSAEDKGPL